MTLRDQSPQLVLALIEVRFPSGTHEVYQVPIGIRPAAEGWTERVIAEADGETFYDALADPAHARELLHLMRSGVDVQASDGTLGFRWSGGADATHPDGRGAPGRRRAVQLLDRVRRGADPEGVPARRAGRRTRSSSCCASCPSATSRTSRRSRGWYQYEGRLMDATLGDAAGVPGRRDRRLGPGARRAVGGPRGVPRAPARARRRDRRAAHARSARRPPTRPSHPSSRAPRRSRSSPRRSTRRSSGSSSSCPTSRRSSRSAAAGRTSRSACRRSPTSARAGASSAPTATTTSARPCSPSAAG